MRGALPINAVSPTGQPSRIVSIAIWAFGLVGVVACGSIEPTSDAEKLDRIDAMTADIAADFPNVPVVSPRELDRLLKSLDVVVVDAREERERAVSIIPGAIAHEAFDATKSEFADQRVVVYCTIGQRSAQYVQQLREAGIDAWNLEGSIVAWTHVGGELVNDDGPTRRLHVYGARWDLAASGYETVW